MRANPMIAYTKATHVFLNSSSFPRADTNLKPKYTNTPTVTMAMTEKRRFCNEGRMFPTKVTSVEEFAEASPPSTSMASRLAANARFWMSEESAARKKKGVFMAVRRSDG